MKFDIIVVGAGHAGVEAAYIASKRCEKVILITSNIDSIGQMSCNPAIGGIAKGNIVREIDALGGIMGKIIDEAGIHFRMLNQTKGLAVWGNRAQADKRIYRKVTRKYLEKQNNLFLHQGMVTGVEIEHDRFSHIIMDSGQKIYGNAVILCMGTFLNGVGHIGLHSFECGRTGEPSSKYLTESLEEKGIKSNRLKTGTPPRIDGRTVDYEKFTIQPGDSEPWPFSYATKRKLKNKIYCWINKTNKETHTFITENLDRSPLYTGKITSIGPKYCPSIEDKIVRFGERDGHTLFLEPEGLDLKEMYLNGLSTSLPFDTQIKMVRSIKGLEKAEIIRPGYAIEYDYFQPLQLFPTLESKILNNVYFAGQINGTSGYEEAACQGLIAAINAIAKIKNEEPLLLRRDMSYIGVLIDDLVTKGTEEPYRMFTSRAENRLVLRQDNSDERLMPIAYARNLISKTVYTRRRKFWDSKKKLLETLKELKITPQMWSAVKNEPALTQSNKAYALLKRPDVQLSDIEKMSERNFSDKEMCLKVKADITYEGFRKKEKKNQEKKEKMESQKIPTDIDFLSIDGMLIDSRNKLARIKPMTIGQATRIPGITPSDITALIMYLIKRSNVSRETVDEL